MQIIIWFQVKKEAEDFLAFKLTSMHWYNDLKTTLKSAEKDWLQRQESTQTAQTSTEQK